MARVVSIGTQNFEKLVANNSFYIDKTDFIREWWESRDEVTLITRPRRFGKTLNMNMLERFWSIKYKGQGELFQNLSIWKEKKYRELQGTYPVISLSFAAVKADNYLDAREQIFQIIENLYMQHLFLKKSGKLEKNEMEYFERMGRDMSNSEAAIALHRLSGYLYRYYGKKVIILLDEYDTPMQEAYVGGYWEQLVSLTRTMFNFTFKTNPYLERGVLTGITRIGKESMFSDLNNLNAASVTSSDYASCFGFTEEEVFAAMDEFGMTNKEEVKKWYDGFNIGNQQDIYNPWSIINFLDKRQLKPYWANTSSNVLAGSLIRVGNRNLKMQFEELLSGRTITSKVNEEIVFEQAERNEQEVWSLLLAAGYLKIVNIHDKFYELALTNYEVRQMFEDIIQGWFEKGDAYYNDFIKALLRGDIEEMNEYMNQIALSMFSSFDGGRHLSKTASPERFYHGFVLGLLVELMGQYIVSSNRESGFGRYDVMLLPTNKEDNGIVLEFKVFNPKKEKNLSETVQAALRQIEEKKYGQALLDFGVKKENIRKYGFAFEGKKVLIGGSDDAE